MAATTQPNTGLFGHVRSVEANLIRVGRQHLLHTWIELELITRESFKDGQGRSDGDAPLNNFFNQLLNRQRDVDFQ